MNDSNAAMYNAQTNLSLLSQGLSNAVISSRRAFDLRDPKLLNETSTYLRDVARSLLQIADVIDPSALASPPEAPTGK